MRSELPVAAFIVLAVCAYFYLNGAADDHPSKPTATDSALSARDCDFWYRNESVQLMCYWFETDDGFRLPLALFSKSDFQAESALLYIPGGPGSGEQTAADNLRYWLNWYDDSALKTDFLVFNPRGVPGSKPYWLCQEYEKLSLELMPKNVSFSEEAQSASPVLKHCLTQYDEWLQATLSNNLGLESFSSEQQARDILAVQQVLEYAHWHVWGVSYGSRVALKVGELSKDDNLLQSVILDSVYPYGVGLESEWAEQQALLFKIHEQRYAKYRGSSKESFTRLWRKAVKKLQAGSQDPQASDYLRSYPNWYFSDSASMSTSLKDESEFHFYLNPHRLLALTSFVNYDANLLADFYSGLEDFVSIQSRVIPDNLYRSIEAFINQSFDPAFSMLVFFATQCSDNPSPGVSQWQAASRQYPQWSAYTKVLENYSVCQHVLFSSPGISGDYNTALPSLLLSGEWDHVTPTRWAESLYQQLKVGSDQSTLIVVPGAGHSVINSGACDSDILTDWIAAVTADKTRDLSTRCQQ